MIELITNRTSEKRYQPRWAPVKFGEDEQQPRKRFTWSQVGWCVAALAIGIYAGLLLSAAWLAH